MTTFSWKWWQQRLHQQHNARSPQCLLLLGALLVAAFYATPITAQTIDTNQFINQKPLPAEAVAWQPTYGTNTVNEFRMIAAYGVPFAAGFAREVILYPWADTTHSYYWPCKFFAFSGGADAYNSNVHSRDAWGNPAHERVYDSGTGTGLTPAGTIIADSIAFGYDSARQIRVWPTGPYDDSSRMTHEIFRDFDQPARVISPTSPGKLYFVVSGHLFDVDEGGNPSSPSSDIVMELEIWNRIPKGVRYRDAYGDTVTNDSVNQEFLYRTIAVTKGDLDPVDPIDPNFDAYREPAFLVNMASDTGVMSGPWSIDKKLGAELFNLRVRFTGTHKVAIRRICIRDTIAQLLMGTDAASMDFRKAMVDDIHRILRGASGDTTAREVERRDRLIRFYSGDEANWTQDVGAVYIDSMIYRMYPNSNDTTRGMRVWRAQRGMESDAETQSSEHEITVETYPYQYRPLWDPEARYGLLDHWQRIPSIAEHNGGKFNIPLLDLSGSHARDSVEIATRMIQYLTYGAYFDGPTVWPYNQFGSSLRSLGKGAWGSRRTGRRLIQWLGVHVALNINWVPQTLPDTGYDKVIETDHVPEPAESRCFANLGLAFGSRGVHYSFIGTITNGGFAYSGVDVGNGITRYNYGSDFGPMGNYTDENEDVYTPLYLTSLDGTKRDTIDTIWTGWDVRTNEIKWLNRVWYPSLWTTMQRLRWRDGYSMHYTVPAPYLPVGSQTQRVRSLPSNEMISSIRIQPAFPFPPCRVPVLTPSLGSTA